MGGRLDGKVALVTGAARGQGKSHCIRLAEEGANIIAVDLCENMASVNYPLGSEADLADTVAKVEATGQRIVATKADVRDRNGLKAAVDAGVAELRRTAHRVCERGHPADQGPDGAGSSSMRWTSTSAVC